MFTEIYPPYPWHFATLNQSVLTFPTNALATKFYFHFLICHIEEYNNSSGKHPTNWEWNLWCWTTWTTWSIWTTWTTWTTWTAPIIVHWSRILGNWQTLPGLRVSCSYFYPPSHQSTKSIPDTPILRAFVKLVQTLSTIICQDIKFVKCFQIVNSCKSIVWFCSVH